MKCNKCNGEMIVDMFGEYVCPHKHTEKKPELLKYEFYALCETDGYCLSIYQVNPDKSLKFLECTREGRLVVPDYNGIHIDRACTEFDSWVKRNDLSGSRCWEGEY